MEDFTPEKLLGPIELLRSGYLLLLWLVFFLVVER